MTDSNLRSRLILMGQPDTNPIARPLKRTTRIEAPLRAGSIATALLTAIVFPSCAPKIDVDDLAARCAAAAPSWGTYDEDIKRDIGAAAAALWSGAPVAVEFDAGTFRVTFRIEGPWSSYPCGLPILLRDPQERLLRPREVLGDGNERVYVFETKGARESALPWISVRYPMREERLLLSQDGHWSRPE